MRISNTRLRSLATLTFFCLPIYAQSSSSQAGRYAKDGLSFEYPARTAMEDRSTPSGQHLVLVDKGTGAQIMVMSRYDEISSADQLAKARHEVADAFADTMLQELRKSDPTVERSTTEIEIGGVQAPGVRFRAVLGGEPGRIEVYSLLLGRRLVIVSLIGTEKEIANAAEAWATIRRSLKVGERAVSAQLDGWKGAIHIDPDAA